MISDRLEDKATEILIGGLTTPPEMDNDTVDEDRRALWAIYESSSYAILEQMNREDFSDIYNILKTDITEREIVHQKVFIDKYLVEMEKIYEFEFQAKLEYSTPRTIRSMFKFVEFVEYDNVTFLRYVWKYLDEILTVNIREYVQENSKTIIDEITNQANLLVTLTENVSEFLRTYNKEGILEWFIDRSERKKYEIYSENLN
jgi:hypothetical protein